ncbi:protein ImuB [Arcanobacterium phocae]|uniref:Protein ImuB n=2 Tax=Arcanobacterium phocae TaxID=131112 RepID=A0A1H2LJ95_9ACTO|nr:protein ImuB [Arcanobacterium phocae]
MYGAIWIPQWSVAVMAHSRGYDATQPIAVVHGKNVTDVNDAAHRQGLKTGISAAYASRYANVKILNKDRALTKEKFDDVMDVLCAHVLHSAILEPGLAVFIVPRISDRSILAETLIGEIAAETGVEAHIGFAPGVYASVQAAYKDLDVDTVCDILDERSVDTLLCSYFSTEKHHRIENFIALAHLLGLERISDIRRLDRRSFFERFGKTAQEVLDLIDGKDVFPPAYTGTQTEVVIHECEEPVTRIDHVAFLAQSMAQKLVDQLIQRNVIAEELEVTIMMSNGNLQKRHWQIHAVEAKGISQRVRWQISSWIRQWESEKQKPMEEPFGITSIILRALHLLPSGVAQKPLWGDENAQYRDAQRAIERVRSLIGESSVLTAFPRGGRYPREAYLIGQWGTKLEGDSHNEWIGQLPKPWPTTLLEKPERIAAKDRLGHELLVDNDGIFACAEKCQSIESFTLLYKEDQFAITKIAGPWIQWEGWWSQEENYYRAWMQCVSRDFAFLIFREKGNWWLDGIYQ